MSRLTIPKKPEDYAAFKRVAAAALEIVLLPIFATVAMPHHRHFVVRPETSDRFSEFSRRLTYRTVQLFVQRRSNAVASGGFGGVHAFVRARQQVIDCAAVRIIDCHHTKTACNFHRTSLSAEGR